MSVPGFGPIPSRLMIVGEAPGADEEREGVPFVGSSGQELDRMLHEAGLLRSEVYVTNLCKYRPPDNQLDAWIPPVKRDIRPDMTPLHGVMVDRRVKEGYDKLMQEIAVVKPELIVTCGNKPLWALTQVNSPWSGVMNWRGSQLRHNGLAVIPTIHPAAIIRGMWENRPLVVHDLRRAARQLRDGCTPPAWQFHVRPTYTGAMNRLTLLQARVEQRPTWIACDIETTRYGAIACLGLAWNSLEAICIPFMERQRAYWTLDQHTDLVLALRDLLTHPNCKVVGQNFLYDAQYMAREWLFIPNLSWDTMYGQNVLYPGTPRALHTLASWYCDYYVFWKEDGKEEDIKVPEDKRWIYNCTDCVRTLEVAEAQQRTAHTANLNRQAEFQMGLFRPVMDMTLRGIARDDAAQPVLSRELELKKQDILQYFRDILGHDLNPNSPKQMHTLFYTDFRERIILNRKTKKPTLDDNALMTIAGRNPLLRPLINAIADYRTLGIFKSTFVDARLDFDGRLRSTFDPSGTETFRFSSGKNVFGSGCNFQAIPSETSKSVNKARMRGSDIELPDVRRLFKPDPGFTFWNADLDRADLQVVVWESGDADLKRALREGIDLHLLNAQVLFDLPFTEEDLRDPKLYERIRARYGAQREFCKTFIHGTNYGGKARTMAENSRCTVAEAQYFQSRWFKRHPGILEWHERTLDSLQATRTVRNAFGYRRYYFDRIDEILPEALAWVPQSTVSCVINRGLDSIARSLPYVQILLQVHDSLAGQFPSQGRSGDSWDDGGYPAQILSCMRITVPYPDPLVIPVTIKTSLNSWGDCH